MRRRKSNFRFHLGVLGALTAVPFILAGAVLAILYVNSERQRTEQDLVSAAKDLSNAIDRQVTGGVSTLKALAFSPSLEQHDLANFYQQATRVAGIFPGSVVGFRRADGQQLVNTALSWGQPLPQTQDPILRTSDRAALATMQPVVSNVYTGISTGQRYAMLNLPIMYEGAPHFLNMAIPPESILRLVQQSSVVRPDWLVIVIDANNRVIARPRPRQIRRPQRQRRLHPQTRRHGGCAQQHHARRRARRRRVFSLAADRLDCDHRCARRHHQ